MNRAPRVNQRISRNLDQRTYRRTFLDVYPIETLARNFINASNGVHSAATTRFYREKIAVFVEWIKAKQITDLQDLGTAHLQEFMTYLKIEKYHSPGGQHCYYRTVKAFLKFTWKQQKCPWENPIEGWKPPRVNINPLPGVELEVVQRLLAVCNDIRDKAIIKTLIDTGVRASELTYLNVEDLSLVTGKMIVLKGKGSKTRTIFMSPETRNTIRRYLKTRHNLEKSDPLFVTDRGERLSYYGLREIIRRRAEDAQVECPGLHDFRRTYALEMRRAGVDIITLSRLMGHSTTEVLKRYLDQTDDDFQKASQIGSPVTNYRL